MLQSEGERKRGRPSISWIKGVDKEMRKKDIEEAW